MTKAKVNEFWVSGFTAETPVIMANGTVKPISKIKDGEWVASFDPKTKERKPARVINTWAEVMNDVLEVKVDDKSMLVASSQLFYTPEGEFKSAPDASKVLTMDGLEKTIVAKKHKGGKVKLYDITVNDYHAFYANGLMVHNKGKTKTPPPPPPPPQPIITAGKIGQPLTVGVNGTNITVNPPAGAVATVSVNYYGGASTGFHSVPGVANINPTIGWWTPRLDYYTNSRYYIDAALSDQVTVCDSMTNTNGTVSSSTKSNWKSLLDRMKSSVQQAQLFDRRGYLLPNVRYTTTVRSPNELVYNDVINDIHDLRKFVSKEKNLSSGDIAFINAKCAEINTSLTAIKARLTPANIPTPPTPPAGPEPVYGGDRTYSTNPNYSYYVRQGTSNDCEYYGYRPPNTTATSVNYYKHFDTSNGLFYFDNTAVNCV